MKSISARNTFYLVSASISFFKRIFVYYSFEIFEGKLFWPFKDVKIGSKLKVKTDLGRPD